MHVFGLWEEIKERNCHQNQSSTNPTCTVRSVNSLNPVHDTETVKENWGKQKVVIFYQSESLHFWHWNSLWHNVIQL